MGRSKAKKKKNKKQLEEEALMLQRIEHAKKLRAEPWKQRQLLDYSLIDRTSESLRYFQEHLAKRVVMLGSIGEKAGRVVPQNSMRAIVDNLAKRVPECQV